MLINHEFSLCSRVFQRELTTCLLSIVNKYIFFFPVFCFHACWSKHCISRRDTSKWHNKGWGPLHCADKISTTSLIHQIDSHHIKVDDQKKMVICSTPSMVQDLVFIDGAVLLEAPSGWKGSADSPPFSGLSQFQIWAGLTMSPKKEWVNYITKCRQNCDVHSILSRCTVKPCLPFFWKLFIQPNVFCRDRCRPLQAHVSERNVYKPWWCNSVSHNFVYLIKTI